MDVLGTIFEFLVVGVIFKIIIAHWLADRIMDIAKYWFNRTERGLAILTHYRSRAAGAGHTASDILDCGQEKCAIFHKA